MNRQPREQQHKPAKAGRGRAATAAAVDDQVRLDRQGGIQDVLVVVEEIVPAPPHLDARAQGQVKAEMGICEEQDSDGAVAHGGQPCVVGKGRENANYST